MEHGQTTCIPYPVVFQCFKTKLVQHDGFSEQETCCSLKQQRFVTATAQLGFHLFAALGFRCHFILDLKWQTVSEKYCERANNRSEETSPLSVSTQQEQGQRTEY